MIISHRAVRPQYLIYIECTVHSTALHSTALYSDQLSSLEGHCPLDSSGSSSETFQEMKYFQTEKYF